MPMHPRLKPPQNLPEENLRVSVEERANALEEVSVAAEVNVERVDLVRLRLATAAFSSTLARTMVSIQAR